jgi:hypothetical protein
MIYDVVVVANVAEVLVAEAVVVVDSFDWVGFQLVTVINCTGRLGRGTPLASTKTCACACCLSPFLDDDVRIPTTRVRVDGSKCITKRQKVLAHDAVIMDIGYSTPSGERRQAFTDNKPPEFGLLDKRHHSRRRDRGRLRRSSVHHRLRRSSSPIPFGLAVHQVRYISPPRPRQRRRSVRHRQLCDTPTTAPANDETNDSF